MQMVRFLQMAYHLASSWRLLKQDISPLSLHVEASMKINAINPRINTRRLDDAPRESYWIHDFRGMRPEPDVTYAFGHAYNHYHRYLSLLRSTFQEGRYRGITRTLRSVELTAFERY